MGIDTVSPQDKPPSDEAILENCALFLFSQNLLGKTTPTESGFSTPNRDAVPTREGELSLPKFRRAWENYTSGVAELNAYQKSHQTVLSVAVCPGIKNWDWTFYAVPAENPAVCLKLDFQSDADEWCGPYLPLSLCRPGP